MDSKAAILLIFLTFFFSVIVFSAIKKVFFYVFFRRKLYIIPRLSIKGMAYTGMTISLSVVVLLVLTIFTADIASVLFRSFPGTRMAFESVLIKAGGLMLGPFLGMILGALTDGIAIIFTAGTFNIGYFLAAISFGFIGGIIRIIIDLTRKYKDVTFGVICLLIIGATLGVISFYMFNNSTEIEKIVIPIINLTMSINDVCIIVGCSGIIILTLNVVFFSFSKHSKIKFFQNQYVTFGPILLCAYLSDLLVSLLLLPIFDAQVTTIVYADWIGIRSIVLLPSTIFNIILLWPVYRLISPIVKYDYKSDYIAYDCNKNYDINQKLSNYKIKKEKSEK